MMNLIKLENHPVNGAMGFEGVDHSRWCIVEMQVEYVVVVADTVCVKWYRLGDQMNTLKPAWWPQDLAPRFDINKTVAQFQNWLNDIYQAATGNDVVGHELFVVTNIELRACDRRKMVLAGDELQRVISQALQQYLDCVEVQCTVFDFTTSSPNPARIS